MRWSWITQVDPESTDLVRERTGEKIQTHKGDRYKHVKGKKQWDHRGTAWRDTAKEAKDHQQPLKQEEARKVSPQSLHSKCGPAYVLISDFRPPDYERRSFYRGKPRGEW